MPVKKGRLKPEDDYKIRKKTKFLLQNFDPINGIMDHLISIFVFEPRDQDFVKNAGETTAEGRVIRFVQVLENSGPDAYQHFISALKATGDEHVAEELESTDVPEANKKDPLAWIDELPDSVTHLSPTEADASRLSAAFGKGWEHIFLELGVSQAKIEQAVMGTHSVSVAITTLINRWRQKNAAKADFTRLLNAVKNNDNVCTIDWELVEKVMKDKVVCQGACNKT